MLRQYILTKPRRKAEYPGPGFQVYVPVNIWERTLLSIFRYQQYDSECLMFWGGGIGASGELYASTLYIPNHPPQGSRAHPDRQAMRLLVRALFNSDQKLIAQVHSHPGEAFHSYGDDENAASYHKGYISIVVPNFGRNVTSLNQCAIYEFDGYRFRLLVGEEVSARFVLESQIIELSTWNIEKEETIWEKLSRKLKFIERKRR